MQVDPGEYIFGVNWSDDLEPLETRSSREVAVNCTSGNTYYIRIFSQIGNGLAIERSSY